MLRSFSLVAVLVGLSRVAAAEPWPEPHEDQPVVDEHDLPVKKKSYLVPAIEILAMEVGANVTSRIAGRPWADVNSDTMWTNLHRDWTWDPDPWTNNALAHPYLGAWLYSAARSTGHGVLVSELYTFTGSAVWEIFLENEIPSLQDQIITPFGGMFLGEAMHRVSRVLLYPGYGKPNWLRRGAAVLIDPVGSANRQFWGDAWYKTVPPSIYAHLGVGMNQRVHALGGSQGNSQMHAQFVVEHGLPGDHNFEPKNPLDHFELRGSLDLSPDDTAGAIYMRGMLWGGFFSNDDVRGFGGAFAAFDFNNVDRVRANAIGVGPGITTEIKLGEQGYLQGSLAGYLVPYGQAGGATEGEKAMRDYIHGPGFAELAEVKLGQRGLGSLRVTTRAYQILGRVIDDPSNDFVLSTTAGAMLDLARHHSIGIESTHARLRTSNTDPLQAMDANLTEVRAFYALTTDEIIGR